MDKGKLTLARLNGEPEVFHSIQGEGRNMGQPSVFVRLSNCNLHCIWCDTDYTWNWEGTRFAHRKDKDPAYRKYDRAAWTVDLQIAELADRIAALPCTRVILTGGEPLLQDEACGALMRELRERRAGYHFAVETNGTLRPCPAFDQEADQYNVSPKLANSNNPRTLREKPEVYRFFSRHPKAWFKFVIEQPADLEEVLALIQKYRLANDRVYLMPEATQPEVLRQRQRWLVEVCKQHGFSYSDRLHIRLYGDLRGV